MLNLTISTLLLSYTLFMRNNSINKNVNIIETIEKRVLILDENCSSSIKIRLLPTELPKILST